MKARYWPCRGVYACATESAGDFPAGLRDTLASLCGEACGRVDESPCEGPAERTGLGTIPMLDEAEDVLRERGDALEAAVAQNAPLKDAEPDLDWIDPGGMLRIPA